MHHMENKMEVVYYGSVAILALSSLWFLHSESKHRSGHPYPSWVDTVTNWIAATAIVTLGLSSFILAIEGVA